MRDFRTLKVWHKAHELTIAVYKASADFPKAEVYGLTGQLRRASASIAANLAEGCGRSGDAELARFVQIAMGSASETEYHLLLARGLGFLDEPEYTLLDDRVTEIKRMLTSFVQTLRSKENRLSAKGISAEG